MGYASALLKKDVGDEQAELERQAKKKGMWGSIGRTLGGLAATIATGGAAAPWAAALASGAGTLAGGALGSAGAGKIKGGKFLQSDRGDLRKKLSAFGSENITGALTSAVTAGAAQGLKVKDLKAEGLEPAKGLDFKSSWLGKGGLKKVGQTIMPGGKAGYWGDIGLGVDIEGKLGGQYSLWDKIAKKGIFDKDWGSAGIEDIPREFSKQRENLGSYL